jgi:hypothetical protein
MALVAPRSSLGRASPRSFDKQSPEFHLNCYRPGLKSTLSRNGMAGGGQMDAEHSSPCNILHDIGKPSVFPPNLHPISITTLGLFLMNNLLDHRKIEDAFPSQHTGNANLP